MTDYEKLGMFYLGRRYDLQRRAVTEEPLLYDSKDLTTHAVCVGMTGSGKTGLCVGLLEEAALDGVPAVIIDPKGDLGNLALTFPELRPADFRPWIDEGEASREGATADAYAAKTAARWRQGLARWDQQPERIARLRAAAEVTIFTPGSSAGVPLSVLRSLCAPRPAAGADEAQAAEALSGRVQAAVSGLLTLLGVDADPLRSREHILISNILHRLWSEGRDLDLAELIRAIQAPPFQRLGVLDLESFFPARDRFTLAMTFNNLLASPGFQSWMSGDPLDASRLLYTPDGRPRLSIISVAHLSEAERMFVVTSVLGELTGWMRAQPGTGSLRAILYMDEVAGYLPPVAMPPSKRPFLTLLKQARAYGLGLVLATQNPADLDYKALSNAGTWFLGRLQTERDVARVLDGLEGASASTGQAFDRQAMEATLAGLDSRVFLLNNVHEDRPVTFNTRWAMSYLRGPLTRPQISSLMKGRRAPAPPAAAAPRPEPAPAREVKAEAPVLPPEVPARYVSMYPGRHGDRPLLYRPWFHARVQVHHANSRADVDQWQERHLLAPLVAQRKGPDWDRLTVIPSNLWTPPGDQPRAGVDFSELPGSVSPRSAFNRWQKSIRAQIYRRLPMTLWRCPALKAYSRAGESQADFQARLALLARQKRDTALEKLRRKYAPKVTRVQDQIQRAEERVGKEQSQFNQKTVDTAVSVGASVLGALFGRKLASVGNVRRVSSSLRSAGRAARERGDIERARQKLGSLQEKLVALEAELEERIARLTQPPPTHELVELPVRPRKADTVVEEPCLVWVPFFVDGDGGLIPALSPDLVKLME